jgi:hypothetical protein
MVSGMGVFARWARGSGPLPDELRGQVSAEGVLFTDEAAPGTVTYRHYRAPGRRYGYRRMKVLVAIVMTERRLLVQGRAGPVIDVGWEEARAGGLTTSLDDGSLLLSFDASAFGTGRSGEVEVGVRTPQAAAALAVAQAKLA